MLSAMWGTGRLGVVARDLAAGWRSGTSRSQVVVVAFLLVGVTACFAVSLGAYAVMPVSTYTLWLLIGLLLLQFRPLVILTVYVEIGANVLAVYGGVHHDNFGSARASGMVALVLAGVLILFYVGSRRTDLPTPIGEAMLADLRARLTAQGQVPPLPNGWRSQSAMLAANDVGYGGDFMMAALDESENRLAVILVDVVGKGIAAGADALHFAGALGGIVGALPPEQTMDAANSFLLRQPGDETFATAVLVSVDVVSGRYTLVSAGHPPVLRWCGTKSSWEIDGARGLALGVLPHPDVHVTTDQLGPGEALLFYTDGVVEQRGQDIEDGIEWLRTKAAAAVRTGFEGAARRIIRQVPRGDDDRAVFLLWRA